MSKRKAPWRRQMPPRNFHPAAAAKRSALPPAPPDAGRVREWALLAMFWSYVLIPLSWGVAATVRKALLLFQ